MPLTERLATCVAQLNALQAQLVTLVAEAAATEAWAGEGIRSLPHWLTWQAGVSPATARQWVRLAEAHDSHPLTMDGFATGTLTADQADAAVGAPACQDAEIAGLAPYATVTQLRTMARAARASTPPEADRDTERCDRRTDENGRLHLLADLDPERGQIVQTALAEAHDRLFHAGHHQPTWADALVDVCSRSLHHLDAPTRRDRYRINVFLDLDRPIPARWENGITLPDTIRRHLDCDATLSPVFTTGGVAISVGRSQRTVPDRTRRLILYRDQTCRYPGCGGTLGLEIHHVHHWEDGGPTDTSNLLALCERCHHRHHRGDFAITGNPDQPDSLTFSDRYGRPIVKPPPAVLSPDLLIPAPALAPYRHPPGAALHTRWLQFPEPDNPD